MGNIEIALVKLAAYEAGFNDVRIAAEVLRLIMELKSNKMIAEEIEHRFGPGQLPGSGTRRFMALLQHFIITNCLDFFHEFCRTNSISIFNADLEFEKADASLARTICIIFLREEADLRPPIRVVE